MRVVKLALISVIVLSVVIFVFSLFFPSQIRISRAISIDAPKERIITFIADLRHWEQWNEMLRNPEFTNKKFAPSVFSSDQMKIELLRSDTGLVKTIWNRAGTELVYSGFSLIGSENTTVVQWYFDFHVKWYPWEKFGSIIFDKQLGPSMEKSLENLKKMAEQKN